MLIDALQDPSIFGQAGGQVETLQTHMSWILLAGPHAYKIKKPVKFGFADFTSLKSRHHFCLEELRLNRRLAPHLYLDVVPIAGSRQSPVLGDDRRPFEYAVKMKRFPQDALLSHVLQRGELTARHMEQLAGDVAAFHGRIEAASANAPFGTPAAVRNPMDANFEYLLREAEDPPPKIRRLQEWSMAEFARIEGTLTVRKSRGFIRECHGDMHLGNMILEDDSVTVFDAIEFNDNLRWIDVFNEVAFVAMDLQERGRSDLAHRFQNEYLECTGDYQGLDVFRYYLVYRALVRAKVKSIRRNQGDLDERARREAERQARGYIDLAESYTADSHPRLWITHGVSGSGKTCGTQTLVDKDGWIRIRSDIERKRLFGKDRQSGRSSNGDQAVYSDEATQRTYQRLAQLAEATVRAGNSVIVDATFIDRAHRDLFRQVARDLNTPFRILDFCASEAALQRRLVSRNCFQDDVSDADPQVLAHQLETEQPLAADEQRDVVIVDSERGGQASLPPSAGKSVRQ
jgi:aminoglycoside phosphotransferase family enzyme/predicted kinase